MPTLSRLLALMGFAVAAAATATSVAVSPNAVACVSYPTFTAKFEKQTVGKKVPMGFGNSVWSGWTVVESLPLGLIPSSGANVIVASNAETSSISINSADVYEIISFSFGCIAQLPGFGNAPASCSILVTSLANTYEIAIQSSGPYYFTSDFELVEQGIAQNLTMVNLGVGSSDFYFQVVEGFSSSTLYVDDVVLAWQNPNCPPS